MSSHPASFQTKYSITLYHLTNIVKGFTNLFSERNWNVHTRTNLNKVKLKYQDFCFVANQFSVSVDVIIFQVRNLPMIGFLNLSVVVFFAQKRPAEQMQHSLPDDFSRPCIIGGTSQWHVRAHIQVPFVHHIRKPSDFLPLLQLRPILICIIDGLTIL